jgi:hypothetical protein
LWCQAWRCCESCPWSRVYDKRRCSKGWLYKCSLNLTLWDWSLTS